MNWLNNLVDEIIRSFPDDSELLIESGGSPSGKYHIGHLREVITSDAVVLELIKRGKNAKHIYFVDDLDALRKVPVNIPPEYDQYLGMPLCDIPSPEDPKQSYSDYFLKDQVTAMDILGIKVEVILSHERYRSGFFVPAIERSLDNIDQCRTVLEKISQRKLDITWSPIQIMENGRLKNRKFVGIDKVAKTVSYVDADGQKREVKYDTGEVKLDWRLDWPGRWWLLGVDAEPFGRDHATKGGSYDTGAEIARDIYKISPPVPIPYDFVNLAGDTKKMSASKGTGINAIDAVTIIPPEVIRFFMLRFRPAKRLYFDPVNSVVRLIDDYSALIAKPDKTDDERQLLYLSSRGVEEKTISSIPFSHLITSYQAALRDSNNALSIIKRSGYASAVDQEQEIIIKEFKFINEWLNHWAPEEVKFELSDKVSADDFTETERQFLTRLADKISSEAPSDADGNWFHAAIYELKDELKIMPNQLFHALYQATIGKSSGPRAGWFLSILPRDWLIKRLRLEQ